MKKAIKKSVSMILVFLMVFSTFSVVPSEFLHSYIAKAAELVSSTIGASSSETYSTDDFTYTLTDEYTKVQILSYIGDKTDVVIPDRIDDKKVTSIANNAFKGKPITSVVFGKYLESVGSYAFQNCEKLTKVTFKDNAEAGITIGYQAFYSCPVLAEVDFGNSVTSIDNYAFYNCYELKSLVFPATLKTIGYHAFAYIDKLTSVKFTGNALTLIDSYAFYDCDGITELSITGTDATIGSHAFYDCDALKTVEIGKGVKTINSYAFQYCSAIESVKISDDVTTIGDYAFRYCYPLANVTLGKGLTTLGSGAFYNCTKLESIVLPDSLATINDSVFSSCTSLKSVSIGSGCTSISSTAFLSDTALETITVSADNTAYTTIDNVIYSKDGKQLVLYPKSKEGSFVVPDTVTTINEYAFQNCDKLTEVTIGKNVATIGNYSFYNCDKLTKVTIKDNADVAKTIGYQAFYNCLVLAEVDFGNNVTSIGNYAFYSCYELKSLVFPATLKTIGYHAFAYNDKITSVKFTGNALTLIDSYAFNDCDGIAEISITGTDAIIGNYAFYDCDALKNVEIGKGVKTINNYAFQYCSALESVKISDDVTTIGSHAFRNCTALANVTLGKGLTSLGTGAFYNCSKLESIVLPDSLTSINDSVFSGCTSLKSVSIGSGCTSISSTAFIGITSLEKITVSASNTVYSSYDNTLLDKAQTTILLYPKNKEGAYVIPDTVTSISEYAFENCDKLTEITIGKNIATISNYAFQNCDKLTKVTIKDNADVAKTIGYNAFDNCPLLAEVNFGNNVTSIGNYAFYNCYELKSLVFPATLKTIGYHAFAYIDKLTSVKFTGNALTLIDSYAFNDCDGITELSITGTDTTIGSYAFHDCDALNTVEIGKGVKTINSYAFQYCDALESVKISDDVTTIGNYAFRYCYALANVTLGKGLTTLGTSAFYNCTKLESIVLPDSLTTINDSVFNGCTSLKSVSIGSGCTSISSTAFLTDTALETITVSADNTAYKSVDNVIYSKDGKQLVLYPKSKEGSFVVPDTVTTINEYAFQNCDKLTEVTIGKNVATIGNYSFYNCDKLTKVTIKDNADVAKTIGYNAFDNCPLLAEVNFGNNVTSIDNYAFYNCYELKSLVFPATLKTIGYHAFAYNDKLTSVKFTGNALTLIDSYAFYDCDGITELSITGTDTTIGNYAFYDCNALKTVEIGKGVKTINSYAFQYCYALESVNISNDVQTIGNYAFRNCNALSTVVLGKGLTSIGTNAFTGYKNLTIFCYEDTYAHTYATGLTNVEIKFALDNYYVVDLKVSQLSSNSATISWKKPNGFDNIDYYVIYKNGVKYDETTATSYTDINLKSGDTYTYGVRAYSAEADLSEMKTVKATPCCSTVKSITLPNESSTIGGLNKVKLIATMSDSLSKTGGVGKFVYSADEINWIDACTANVQSDGATYVAYWDLKDILTGDYKLRFLFTDRDGGQSFADAYITVDRTHPAQIDEVTITPRETAISLSWQISKEYNTNIYRIYRRAESEEKFELITEIRNRDTLTYTDKKVVEGVTYYYYVVGTDAFGQESLKYDIVSAGLIDDLVEPAFTAMTPRSNSYIHGNTYFNVTSSDNVGVTKTELYFAYDFEAAENEWTLLETNFGSSFAKYVDTTVMKTGEVFIKAKIYDAVGNFTYSPAYKYYCDNQGPEKVTGVDYVLTGGTTATLSWNDVADADISYFLVEVKQADGTFMPRSKVYSYKGINLTQLVPETEYTFRVIGYDRYGNRGTESDEITFTTLKDTLAPAISRFNPAPGYYKATIPLVLTATDDYQVASIIIETSSNKSSWTKVAELKAETLAATTTFNYSLDISKYKEGSVFVRAFVIDTYGNKTAEDDATCYEYVADRTPSSMPTNIKASSDGAETNSYVCISWDAITGDNSFSHFNVYRSTTEDGEYTLIKNKLTTVNTYDQNVEYSKTYYYKVESVDKAGNSSGLSKAVSCKVRDDETKPVIHSISPASGNLMNETYHSVKVAASDNAKLSNLKVEYKTDGLFSSYTTLKEITDNTKTNCTATVEIPVADLNDGTVITVRVTASDGAGNEADEVTANYIVDKTAPEVKNLAVTKAKDSNDMTLSWVTDLESEAICFYIYRKTGADKSYVLYDTMYASETSSSYTYSDDELKVSDISVQYKIEAYDKIGNFSGAETELVKLTGKIPPTVHIASQSTVVTGSEYKYDASGSWDDSKIVSYTFNFGDGTGNISSTTGEVLHIYGTTGTYTLKVTVVDDEGNQSTSTKEITVTSRELVGTVTVKIIDDSNRILVDAPVYLDLGEETEQRAVTDSKGCATFETSVGTHIVASYKTDYLPVKQQVTVTKNTTQVTLVLVNEPIVTGEFEIHQMTFDEIVAAGIDINAAENRNVVKINVTLVYEKQPIQSVIYWNGTSVKSDPIYVKTPTGTRKLTPHVFGGGGGGGSFGGGGVGKTENPTVIYIDVPVEFSYLKEFFSVSLHILNHATSDFSLLNNTVKLNVPNGLSVVKTDVSEPFATAYIDEIVGQSQETVKWILRGDKPGKYDITADYFGVLSYFNEPVTATFKADDPIEVHDASSLVIDVEAATYSYQGKVFYNVSIENTGDYAYNGFSWDSPVEPFVDEYVDANGESFEMETQKQVLNPGEKFVYHYYQNTGDLYKFVDSIISDLSQSHGANIKVTQHPPTYFLDWYYRMFPEEKGDFVFRVKDKEGNPIEGAKITLNPSTSFNTNEKGIVIVEDRSIKCSTLKVECEGYYDYVENNYMGVARGTGDTIILHREGEFVIDEVLVNGKDVLSTKVTINRDNENKPTVAFISRIYGSNIASVDYVQNGKVLTPNSRNSNTSTHTYTNVYTAKDFVVDKEVTIKVTLKDGTETLVLKNLSVKNLPEFNFSVEDVGSMTATTNDPDGLFDGLSFELDLEDLLGVSYAVNMEERTVTVKISPDVDLNNDDLNESFDDLNSKIRDKLSKYSLLDDDDCEDGPISFDIDLEAAVELKIRDDGTTVFSKATAGLFVGVSLEYEHTVWIEFIPVTIGVGGSVKTGVEAELSYDDAEEKFGFSISRVHLEVGVNASVGLGVKDLQAGIYGEVSLKFATSINPTLVLNQITSSGEIGLFYKAWCFSGKYALGSYSDAVLYQNGANFKNAISAMLADAYDPDTYELNNEILGHTTGWKNAISVENGTNTLFDNAYVGTKPQIAVCGDNIIMVYQSVDNTVTKSTEALALYYTVYNKSTGKWSTPAKVDNNKLADNTFSLAVCNDKIYLVYTQSNSEISESSSFVDALKSIDVYAAKFDATSGAFTDFARLSSNSTYDLNPVIKSVNGVPTAIWINNASENPFSSDGNNTIMMSSCNNGSWSDAQAIKSKVGTIVDLDTLGSDKNGYIVYTVDADDELATANDKSIVLYNTTDKTSKVLAENIESAFATKEILGKQVVMWYQDSMLMQYTVSTGKTTAVSAVSASITNGFEIVTDNSGNYAIVYNENSNTASAIYLDTETGKWSKPVTIAESADYIEGLEAEYVDGKLTLMYYDTQADVTEEDLDTTSSFVSTIASNGAKPEITSVDFDLNSIKPSEKANLTVSVKNNSAVPTGNLNFTVLNYDGTVLGTYTTEGVSLSAGGSDKYTVPFTVPAEILNRNITVAVTDSAKSYVSYGRVNLAYCDLDVTCSQYMKDGRDYARVEITNNYYYATPAVLELYNRLTGEVLHTVNISSVENGYPQIVLVEVDSTYADAEGMISARVKAKADEYYTHNNTDIFEYSETFDDNEVVLIGDVDGDGTIKVVDVTLLQKALAQITTLSSRSRKAADVNCDGKVTVQDVTFIQSYLADYTDRSGYCGKYSDDLNSDISTTTNTTVNPSTQVTTVPVTTVPVTTVPVTTIPVTTVPVTTVPVTTVPVTTAPTTKAPETQPTTASDEYIVIGDVNLDKYITIKDVSLLNSYLAKYETLNIYAIAAADTNGDGNVNVDDVTCLQSYLVGNNYGYCGTLIEKATITTAPTTVPTTVAPTTVAPTTKAPTTVPSTVAPTTKAPETQPTTASDEYIVIGDVNLDKYITIKDVSLLNSYLAKYETLNIYAIAAADTNGDGNVNVDDVTCLQSYLVGNNYGYCGTLIEKATITTAPTTVPTTVAPTTKAPTTVPSTVAPTTKAPETQPTTASDEYIVIGDVNLDKYITIKDVSLLNSYLAKYETLNIYAIAAADTNGDGNVNVDDVTCLQSYLVGNNYGYCGTLIEKAAITTAPTIVPTTVAPTTVAPTTQPTTVPEGNYVYYKNTGNWSNVYAYYWSDSNKNMVSWPGVPMERVSNTDYRVEIPQTATKIIFSNNGANQTADLTIPAFGYIYSGSWSKYGVQEDTYTMNFVNANNWSGAIKCYYWSDDNYSMINWPGADMTYKSVNEYGQSVYTIEVPTTVDYVIFTNGSAQTVDIPVSGSSNFYTTGSTDSQGKFNVAYW